MGQKTTFLATALVEHALGHQIWTPPATWYVALSHELFDPNETGSSIVEPTAGDYARLALTNDTSKFPGGSGSNPVTLANGTAWAFAAAVADWGTILSVYLADAVSGGNLCYGTNTAGAGVPIGAGSGFTVPVGAFVVREK